MEADPNPASLEKAARWNPMIITPSTPPATPSGENAPSKMAPNAVGTDRKFTAMTTPHATT